MRSGGEDDRPQGEATPSGAVGSPQSATAQPGRPVRQPPVNQGPASAHQSSAEARSAAPGLLHRWLIAPLLGQLGRLSATTADRLGGTIGVLAWRLGVRRRLSGELLTRCLGVTGPARARLVRRSYATMGANFLALWTVGGPEGVERSLTVLNPTWLRLMLKRHPAVLFLTPHLGSWDLGAHAIAKATGRIVAYAKPQHNAEVDALINAKRAALGIEVIMAASGDRQAAMKALRAARSGIPVGLMGDQRPGRHEGAPARFFGHAAWCHQGPAFFALKAKMALLPGFCVRRRAGQIVGLCGAARTAEGLDEAAVVQLAIDLQCAMIAGVPGQYFWQHKRFAGSQPEVPPRQHEPWRGRLRFMCGRT